MARYVFTLFVMLLGVLMVVTEVQAESRHVLKGRVIRSLAVDPQDPNHLLVGQKGAKPGSALVFQTLDGGETWRTLNNNRPLDPNATDVQAVAALSKEILLAGTWKHGLYRSSNGGKAFVRLDNFPSQDIRDLQFADGVIYAATGRDGVFSSQDLGESWQALGAKGDFLWSLTAANGQLFASSPEMGVHQMKDASWEKIFTSDKAYAFASHSTDSDVQAVAGETGLYVTSGSGWQSIMPGDKLADVLFIDKAHMLAASWSQGLWIVATDGAVQKRLLEDQAIVHLQRANDQLFIGTWGKGLHILPMADVWP